MPPASLKQHLRLEARCACAAHHSLQHVRARPRHCVAAAAGNDPPRQCSAAPTRKTADGNHTSACARRRRLPSQLVHAPGRLQVTSAGCGASSALRPQHLRLQAPKLTHGRPRACRASQPVVAHRRLRSAAAPVLHRRTAAQLSPTLLRRAAEAAKRCRYARLHHGATAECRRPAAHSAQLHAAIQRGRLDAISVALCALLHNTACSVGLHPACEHVQMAARRVGAPEQDSTEHCAAGKHACAVAVAASDRPRAVRAKTARHHHRVSIRKHKRTGNSNPLQLDCRARAIAT